MPDHQQVPDEQLILDYYACDDAAFEELERRYRGMLFGFFRRLSADEDVAADLTQETLLKVVNSKDSGRGRYQPRQANFRTWLFRIAYNVWCDHMRRVQRAGFLQPIPGDDETSEERRAHGAAPEVPVAPWPGAANLAVARDFLDALKECLKQLTADRRTAFVLVYWLGLTAAEAAQVMGRSQNAVWQLIHNGLSDLRNCLRNRGYRCRDDIDPQALRNAMANSVDELIRLSGSSTFSRFNDGGGAQQ
mgnify:CR=1 FL=1